MKLALRTYLLAAMLLASLAHAGSYTRAITNRIMILGPAEHTGGNAYTASNAYSQGTFVTNNHLSFFVLDAGTSGTSGEGPTVAGENASSTTVFFATLPGRRSIFTVTRISGGVVTLQGFGDRSSTNYDGVPLGAGIDIYGEGDPGCWQGAIYAVSTGSTISVSEH